MLTNTQLGTFLEMDLLFLPYSSWAEGRQLTASGGTRARAVSR
jgi:hypothetical protein